MRQAAQSLAGTGEEVEVFADRRRQQRRLAVKRGDVIDPLEPIARDFSDRAGKVRRVERAVITAGAKTGCGGVGGEAQHRALVRGGAHPTLTVRDADRAISQREAGMAAGRVETGGGDMRAEFGAVAAGFQELVKIGHGPC